MEQWSITTHTTTIKTKLYKFFHWFFSGKLEMILLDILVILVLIWTIKHFAI